MTTYRNIHGRSIQSLATDPTESVAEGQIWYNTTSDTFKSIVSAAAWSSAASMSTARSGLAGGGTQTASWGVGGVTSFPATTTTATEEYNGSGWATGGAIPTGKVYAGAAGPQTAGLIAGGGPPFSPSPGGAQTTSFSYNGTAWAAETATPVGLWTNAGFGSEPAFVSVGSEPSTTNYVFNYNGSSWTTGGTMNSIRSYVGACGTQTAGGAIAGHDGAAEDKFETYDGSSWTAAPTLNTARYTLAGAGSLTSALAAGGRTSPGPSNATELYDGSSWTNSSNMGTGTAFAAESNNAPNNTAAVVFAGSPIGDPSTILATSEEFNISTSVITAGAWASGGALNSKHNSAAGAGIQTAALVAGGNDGNSSPPHVYSTPETEEYDGTSWSEQTDLTTSRFSLSGSGSQTAGLAAGGNLYPGKSNATEEYDGSSWTNGGNLPTGVDAGTMFGIQTASVFCGGYAPSATTTSSEYNGSTWTAGNALNTARKEQPGGFGLESAGIAFAGTGPGTSNVTESYDGTNWTTVNTMNLTHTGCWAAGTQSDGTGGGGGPVTTSVENYDGTTWRTGISLSTGRAGANGLGSPSTAAAALVSAGDPSRQATEEFTAETTAVNVKTLTQS